MRRIDFKGRYFASTGPLNVVPSPQARPVIIMAGTSPRGLRFAVDDADMVIAHKNSIEDMRGYTTALRAMLAQAGRDPSSCKVFFSIKPVMGDTPAIAEARWEQNVAKTSVEEGLADLSSALVVPAAELPQRIHPGSAVLRC